MYCSASPGSIALAAHVVILCFIFLVPTEAQNHLFDSHGLVQVRIEAPFRRMISEEEGRFAAKLIFAEYPGDTIHLEVSPRGKSRLFSGICDFPGLMLFFPDGAAGSAFEGQGAVPVVTHCRDRDAYEQLALLEYLAYRTYNVVTELSLRVRLARIAYFDSERDRLVTERVGFFLENYEKLASRNGWVRLRLPVIPPYEYEADQRALFEVFQYFIGNTDWSYTYAPPGETECCHNAVPIGNFAGPVFPVPFDFDQAGLVDAPYATVDPSLRIRRVRDRLFRGICGPPGFLNGALGLFEIHQPEIKALFEEAEFLNDRSRSKALRYLEEFYRTIEDDRRVERELLSKCREP
jgi:hypothetical protein